MIKQKLFWLQKTSFNSDSVPQSINLEGSDIQRASTNRKLGVCVDPTLSFQQQISACRIYYLELRRISAIRHYLSDDVTKKTVVCVCSFKTRLLQLTFGGQSKYLLSKLQNVQNWQCCKTDFQNNQICPRHSYVSFSSLATHWAEDRIQIVFDLL